MKARANKLVASRQEEFSKRSLAESPFTDAEYVLQGPPDGRASEVRVKGASESGHL